MGSNWGNDGGGGKLRFIRRVKGVKGEFEITALSISRR